MRSLSLPLPLCALAWTASALLGLADAWHTNKTNFLFIMYDDLRPELSVYGNQDMITPNFERLAQKSVVFDYAFCQIAVCNPSRDSLLTGLRPDTVGTYGFQWSFRPNMAFPGLFTKADYKTSGYGKIFHWDGPDKDVWNHEQWDGDWYEYQNKEVSLMNASTMADKVTPEEEFRDYLFTSRAIATMQKFHAEQQLFMVGLGFKLPHLQVHVPFKYFDMYRQKQQRGMWKRRKKELKFPNSAPIVAYKCCAHPDFRFMKKDGGEKSRKQMHIGRLDQPFTQQMHTELSWGYAAAVTFLDAQLGRLLDAIDELNLWPNLTIVLTSDHGMHNGEKGLWQKWTTYDESTRVPLMISHPQSPFQGQRFSEPVELIDIFPTVLDMFPVNPSDDLPCDQLHKEMRRCQPLQGKSLAPVVLGTPVGDMTAPSVLYNKQAQETEDARGKTKKFKKKKREKDKKDNNKVRSIWLASHSPPEISKVMPSLGTDLFAVSQTWQCADKQELAMKTKGKEASTAVAETVVTAAPGKPNRNFESPFFECNRDDNKLAEKREQQVSVMGYTFRSSSFRYTAWIHWDRVLNVPELAVPLYAEELYDHRRETLQNFTHLELVNLAQRPEFREVVARLRSRALLFLKNEVKFRGPYVPE